MEPDGTRPFRGSDAVRSGVLTRSELFGPRHRRVGRDTYVLAAAPTTALGRIDAALVAAGPTATATGWSACAVLGLDVAPGPQPVEVAVADRQPRSRPGVLLRHCRIPEGDVVVEDGRRATSPLRTAFDLARRAGATRQLDEPDPLPDVVAAVDALARLGEFGGADLEAFARSHPGARHVRRVLPVAQLVDARSDSPPESRMRVRLVRDGLPVAVVQHEVPTRGGRRTLLLDLAWPEFGVAVEYDGKDHALADRRGRDIDRLDDLRRQGWLVIVVTAVQARRPHWVAERVREALLSRGWSG